MTKNQYDFIIFYMEKEINFNVYNMLNLHNEKLGKLYIEKGFNPYGDNYEFTVDEVVNLLDIQKNEKTLNFPDFLEKTPKEIKEAYQNSLNNTIEMKTEAENSEDLENESKTYITRYFDMRKALLEIEIESMNSPEFNETQSFQEISSLDKLIGDFMEETFEKQSNNFYIFSQIKNLLKSRLENKKEKEKQAKLQRDLAIMNMKVMQDVQKEKANKKFNKLKKYNEHMAGLADKVEKSSSKIGSAVADVGKGLAQAALDIPLAATGFVKETLTGGSAPLVQGFLEGWGHNAFHPEKWFEKKPNYEKLTYQEAVKQTQIAEETQQAMVEFANRLKELEEELRR